ncbi:biosynthetic peptidoglycan transglycosylase [Anaerorhabdus furcosa]|uniref:peptidoglycan glycosyltransferase n=1 Tax=Anaerorhabdus furcosa TaxID=118967 RepID=A0A1T4K6X2_9FIRM|nr:biosynthetic peptidoglycan transglycosylase [Anaerorhabdus furcosa]SJZ38169.1 Transglycosylase [Anaerorhabdus furcosa]
MKRAIILSVMAIMLFVLSLCAPIINDGYAMYKNATKEKDLATMIQEIRSNENYVTIDQISPDYLAALIQSEDHRFYEHFGLDVIALTRAFVKNIAAGKIKEGGSTITQQLAKNLYFSFEKKYERKVAELFVVFDLENNYTKDEILELYVNIIYFGEDCYGIKEASLHYFNKLPNQLNQVEINALVYTIKSPNNYNPNKLKLTYAN